MLDKSPLVFISYSWTTQDHIDNVLALATRLVDQGVDVLLDKWDLKEGQDKYHFMENCVNNINVDKVLLICDKAYKEKADSRIGGVGDETAIISAEVYGNATQEKFLPIIFESDFNKKPYIPTYIKSRIYFDLTEDNSDYEKEYEKLLRNIYEMPLFKKPPLGNKPEWLENDSVNLTSLKEIIKQIKGCIDTNLPKADVQIREFADKYYETLKEYRIIEKQKSGEMIVSKIIELKPMKDIYIDFLEILIKSTINIADVITSFFENMYNTVLDCSDIGNSYSDYDIEYYNFLIWELFINTTALLFHFEKYSEIHDVLWHTYFLRDSYFKNSTISATDFITFRQAFNIIEKEYKPKSTEPDLYSYSAKMLTQRENKPYLTSQAIANADIILYQLSQIHCSGNGYSWYPISYIYSKTYQNIWIKLKSQKFCNRILPLFGVKTSDELKEILNKFGEKKEMGYQRYLKFIPNILGNIKLDEIASLD